MIHIFEHPSWEPTSMKIWVGVQNFSFPTLFDFSRELLLIIIIIDLQVALFWPTPFDQWRQKEVGERDR